MTAQALHDVPGARAKPAHLELRGLSAGYGQFLVLRELSLEARPGVTVILGPNGAGKSTLLKAIAGPSRVAGRCCSTARPFRAARASGSSSAGSRWWPRISCSRR